jgi:hypothetical protein
MIDLDTIKDFYNTNGRPPTKREIKGHDALVYKYGTWNGVLKAAGLPVNLRYDHSVEELIASLRRFFDENGKSPRASDCNSIDYLFDTKTYLRKLDCKTWGQVLNKAGLQEYFEISKLNSLPDDELLSLVANVLTLGDNTTKEFYDANRGPLPSFETLHTRFGTWSSILKRLNIRPNLGKYTDEELLSVFYETKEYYGYVPSTSELEQYANIPIRQWTKRFGAYNIFLKRIGEDIHSVTPKEVKETNEELKQLYIRFSEENGYKNGATISALKESDKIYNSDVFLIRFGSINKLRKLCGYETTKRGRKIYEENTVYTHLREVYRDFGRIPTREEYKQHKLAIPLTSLYRITCSTSFIEAFEKAIGRQRSYSAKYYASNKGRLYYFKDRLEKAKTEETKARLREEIAKIEAALEQEEKLKKQIKTKRCSKCGEVKEYSSFYKDKQMKDGCSSYCISCIRNDKQANKEKYRKHANEHASIYSKSIPGQIAELKRLLKKAKKQETKTKLIEKIAELKKQLNNNNQ